MEESLCKRRFCREMRIMADGNEFLVDSDTNDFRNIRALIKGPPNTPYEGSNFIMSQLNRMGIWLENVYDIVS